MTGSAFSPLNGYTPEAVWQARRAFFDEGRSIGFVQDAVLRSWTRCSGTGMSANESVEFAPVERHALRGLIERNIELLQAASEELATLARCVSDAGYAVLLTDANSHALLVDGAIQARSLPLRQAFRPGVDLSESSIGTTAMSVAISEREAARIQGAEHFFEGIQMFHCSAAPVFDPQGDVIGAVDVSRDTPGMLTSAVWLAERCAQRIERKLFERLPSFLQLEIDVGEMGSATSTQVMLAFREDGKLIAASRAARQLMNLPLGIVGMPFGDLFDARFEEWISSPRRSKEAVPLALRDGLQLRARGRLNSTPPLGRPGPRHSVDAQAEASRPTFGDERLDAAFDRALRAFRAQLPVLITGETGCGKEVAARALHAAGSNSSGPFIAVNCAAVPAELLATELFGHVDGAFTGARRGGASGKIEAAHRGTLFLDEIGDMPPALQAALLRVLDSKEVVPLGATSPRSIDVRIVCATNRRLQDGVSKGWFREDLFYRVAGHSLHLLPLRERRNIDAVVDALLERHGCDPSRFDGEVRSKLRLAKWPGNVRQLDHAIRRALALAEDPASPIPWSDIEFEVEVHAHDTEHTCVSTGLLAAVQDAAIETALAQTNGNVTKAAKLLGMGRATLYRRLSNSSDSNSIHKLHTRNDEI